MVSAAVFEADVHSLFDGWLGWWGGFGGLIGLLLLLRLPAFEIGGEVFPLFGEMELPFLLITGHFLHDLQIFETAVAPTPTPQSSTFSPLINRDSAH